MPLDLDSLLRAANAARANGDFTSDAERLLDARFGAGDRLAAYGSLRPGGANHPLVAGCPGTWSTGFLRGWLTAREWPMLVLDPRAALVEVAILNSSGLRGRWPVLDAFEGADYRRVLAVAQLADGGTAVVNLYAATATGS